MTAVAPHRRHRHLVLPAFSGRSDRDGGRTDRSRHRGARACGACRRAVASAGAARRRGRRHPLPLLPLRAGPGAERLRVRRRPPGGCLDEVGGLRGGAARVRCRRAHGAPRRAQTPRDADPRPLGDPERGDRRRRRDDLPLVISLHGSDIFVAERNRLAGWAARRAFGRADRVTGCSADLRDRAVALGADDRRAETLLHGVDADRFTPSAETRARVRARHGIGADDSGRVRGGTPGPQERVRVPDRCRRGAGAASSAAAARHRWRR